MNYIPQTKQPTKVILHVFLRTLARQPYLSRKSLHRAVAKELTPTSAQYLKERGGSEELNRLYYYLVQRGYIRRISGRADAATVTITDKGLARLRKLRFEPLEKRGRWDGKWRVVSLDLPKDKAHLRGEVRRNIKELGFARLHRGLWIHPLSCSKQISGIRDNYELGNHISLMEVSDFDQYDRYFDIFQNVIL